jgi:hypothetical protein
LKTRFGRFVKWGLTVCIAALLAGCTESDSRPNPAPIEQMGDRQLNRALHTIVLVRMRQDLATKAYLQRRLAEGKTVRDIKRCLKRSIARQLFRQLELVPRPLDGT